MILGTVALSMSMSLEDMDGVVLAGVAAGDRWTPMVDKELLLGCVLHESRIVVMKWNTAAVWVWFADRSGNMKAGRVHALRRNKDRQTGQSRAYLVNVQTFVGVSGAWWRGVVGALSRRGGLAEGYAERWDYLAADRTRAQRNPVIVAPYELKRAQDMSAAALSFQASAPTWHADAAARYVGAAGAYLADAEQDYTAVTGLTP